MNLAGLLPWHEPPTIVNLGLDWLEPLLAVVPWFRLAPAKKDVDASGDAQKRHADSRVSTKSKEEEWRGEEHGDAYENALRVVHEGPPVNKRSTGLAGEIK